MTRLNYRSQLWRMRKKAYYQQYERACAACGKTEPKQQICLHHMSYDHPFGDEPDEILIPLCKAHHIGVHRFASAVYKEYDLEEATEIYIRLTKAGKSPMRFAQKRSQRKRNKKHTKPKTLKRSSRGRFKSYPNTTRKRPTRLKTGIQRPGAMP